MKGLPIDKAEHGRWRSGDIAQRVASATALTTLTIVLALGALSYWNTRQLIERQIASRLEVDASEIADRISDRLNEIARSAESLASNMMVVNALIDSQGRETYILPFLRSHDLAKQGVTITLHDFRGMPLASSMSGRRSAKRADPGLVSRTVRQGKPFAAVAPRSGGVWLDLAMPLIYPATGQPEGMLVMTADLAELMLNIVSAEPEASNLSVRLLAHGRILWTHERFRGGHDFEWERPLKVVQPLDRLDLAIAFGTVAGEAYLPLRKITAVYGMIGLVIVAITVGLAILHGRRIARPLEQLSAAARTVAETGSLAVQLPVEGTDEISSLSSSFNTMLARLRESSELLEQRVRERTQELAAANATLRDNETFISSILNTVDEGFIVVDRDYHIITANEAFCRQAERPLVEVQGKECYRVSHFRERPCFEHGEECAVRRVFETGAPASTVHLHTGTDSAERHVETRAFPLRDSGGNIHSAIEVIADITSRVHLEEQLRQAQKMEAVGLLAGGIAHDFNNVLTAIMGYANILKLKMPAGDPLGAYVEQVLQAVARAVSLTQGLLTFSRKQVIRPSAVDLNQIVLHFEGLLRRLVGEDIELKVKVSSDALIIMADKGQIEQMIMNLVTNARDAMPQGGTLEIETGLQAMDEGFIREHGFRAEGMFARLTVGDNGAGMDARTRQRIFEPFFTTKEQGRGTGLGLSIVYGAVQQNQGVIEVESEPGKGTRFHLFFPVLAMPEALPEVPQAAVLRGGSETILVAEDEKPLRDLAANVLREFGYEVIEAADGFEAVEKFVGAADRVRLALLDVVMPRKNGKEAANELRRVRPDIRVLFMSGYSADIVSGKGIIDGREHLLGKPFSPADLLARIREMLDAH